MNSLLWDQFFVVVGLLEPEAAAAVENLLPDYANGDLSSLCVWPDQVRHWYRYRWDKSLHFIDTPDVACSYEFSRDCHDQHGVKDMCVAGAIQNFTSQLLHFREGSSDRPYNMTEALLFLSHFMGDIHQPMHVGFTTMKEGTPSCCAGLDTNRICIMEIILTALKDYYEQNLGSLQEDLVGNFTDGIWYDDVAAWEQCDDLLPCLNKYATESMNIACKWGYKGVMSGQTLAEEYFDSRMPM
ncbi:Endonuclease 1 [Hibiscus syriacus]|uniref:Aspergillus nuclease S1 n=1 Tax=Hibiscus syriacus TaxID=106335 RepID=A0A6A3BSE9_HIBSY|nr:Endonuclease 1 [Hibiscus syriacus]